MAQYHDLAFLFGGIIHISPGSSSVGLTLKQPLWYITDITSSISMVGHVIMHNKITKSRFQKYVQFGKRVVINQLIFGLYMCKFCLKQNNHCLEMICSVYIPPCVHIARFKRPMLKLYRLISKAIKWDSPKPGIRQLCRQWQHRRLSWRQAVALLWLRKRWGFRITPAAQRVTRANYNKKSGFDPLVLAVVINSVILKPDTKNFVPTNCLSICCWW